MLDSNTLVLLHFDDDTVIDATGRFWNTYGNISIDATSKVYGYGSAYVDGNVTAFTDNNSDFNFGSGDFTFDFWWKQPVSGNVYYGDCGTVFGTVSSGSFVIHIFNSGSSLSLNIGQSYIGYQTSFTTNIRKTDGIFHHYAVVRKDSVIYLFIDGELLESTPNSTLYNCLDSDVCIFGQSSSSSINCIIGNFDEFRISNVARWTSDFTPPTYSYGTNFAFLANNSLYTGTSLTNLTINWSGLTNTEKEALVESFSEEIPSIQDLASISPFRVLTNGTSTSNVKVTGQPKVQTIEPTSLINTGSVSTVQSINITNTITDTTVKFAITTDLTTYKVYDATQGDWVTATNIEEDGMSIAQINALTPEILALLDVSNGIAFKQCFIATSENASAELSEISAVVDIDGSWSQSVHGTDYSVVYPNKTTMSVRLLTNGDYIINYPISSSS